MQNTVVYTGTHDNNTTLGWGREDATETERENVQIYTRPIEHDGDICWTMIRMAATSVANLCIIPLQDILHLGSEARMNTPAAAHGNWAWRYNLHALHPDFATKLAAMMEMTDRDGKQKKSDGVNAGEPTEEAQLSVRRVRPPTGTLDI